MSPLGAAAVGLIALGMSAASDLAAQQTSALPAALRHAAATGVGPVETEMRHVDLRVPGGVVLHIRYLRGRLFNTRKEQPPWFDDPTSFDIAIDTAVVAVAPPSLTALFNTYVFNYPGKDIRNLKVAIDGSHLVQTGVLDKALNVSFRIRSTVSVTPDGRLRLHPVSVRAAGVGVTGLMDLFGVEMDDLVKVRSGRGVEIVDDDFLIAPERLLPPPRMRGRVIAVKIENGMLVQTLVGRAPRAESRLTPPRRVPNYMFYRGHVLRFGKLTMSNADLLIVDADPSDPFDFFLARVNDQIVAGSSRNMADYGLVTTLPDFGDIGSRPKH